MQRIQENFPIPADALAVDCRIHHRGQNQVRLRICQIPEQVAAESDRVIIDALVKPVLAADADRRVLQSLQVVVLTLRARRRRRPGFSIRSAARQTCVSNCIFRCGLTVD